MSVKAFAGGAHPPYFKELSRDQGIKEIPNPEELIIPLSQHTGAPCEPLVSVGDKVTCGQKLGESKAFVSAPVHTPLDGEVKAIEERLIFTGDECLSIVIAVNKEQKPFPQKEVRNLEKVEEKEILSAIREAGLVGMGGAAFPTAVKLSPPPDKPVDTVIINGCECEPFLTCDYRLMLEQGEELLAGAGLIMKLLKAETCYLAVEDNKMDAIKELKEKIRDERIQVVSLHTKYPQGSEKQLIKALLGREVPSGGLPFDVGALVQNVGTTIAIYQAVRYNKPLMERVVTVTGQNIQDPANLLVKVGTPIRDLIEACGGLKEETARVIMGGPMTGFAQFSLEVPVVKGTSGLVILPPSLASIQQQWLPCVRCSSCVDSCPMLLYPCHLSTTIEEEDLAGASDWDLFDCIECGVCSYVCPSKRPIVHQIKGAKAQVLLERQNKAKAGEKA